MYSFVITIAIDVKRAVDEAITITMRGLINEIVDVVIADPDPKKIQW